jgi:hypothetical protein
MSFADAQRLQFTGERQPSLAPSLLRKDIVAKKEQALERAKLGSSRVVHTLAPNITKLKNKANFNIASASRVRGSVVCNNIYSQNGVSHLKPPLPHDGMESASADEVQKKKAMAKDKLLDAMKSIIFMCGMAPLDLDDPCYAIFHCDSSLDCDTHIESEFYTSKIQPKRIDIWCHCADANDSPVTLNTFLNDSEGP